MYGVTERNDEEKADEDWFAAETLPRLCSRQVWGRVGRDWMVGGYLVEGGVLCLVGLCNMGLFACAQDGVCPGVWGGIVDVGLLLYCSE